MIKILEQLEPEAVDLLRKLLEADERLPREDRGNFLFEERWTRKYNMMPRARVEETLKTNSIMLSGGKGTITSIDQLPPEYDRDLVRHAGFEGGYTEVIKIDLDALKAYALIEFESDKRTFSLTTQARGLRKHLQSGSTAQAGGLPPYADADQPWFSEIRELKIVTAQEFSSLDPEVVILTAVKTERDMVLRSMRPLPDQSLIAKVTAGPDTYYVGMFGRHKAVLVMSEMGATGRAASILTTSDAIRRWNPKAVIAVGIAFGMYPAKQRIGDVLISKTVTNYEPQRVQDDGTIPRGGTVEAGLHLVNRFTNVHGWAFQRPDGTVVDIKPGQVLSGEKLVDSMEFKRQLLEKYPEAIGGEMEGAGLYAAAERAKVEWIIVKGICDWGDGNKKKIYQNLAAAAAVSLVEHVLNEENTLSELRRPHEKHQGKDNNERQDDGGKTANTRKVIASGERSVAIGGDVNNANINTGDVNKK